MPRAFTIYAATVVAGAIAALIAFSSLAGVGAGLGTATFWLLAAFVLVGELLPSPFRAGMAWTGSRSRPRSRSRSC